MPERKETPEKFGVIFVIWDGKNIQLEERLNPQSTYFGFTIIPGGGVEVGEIYEKAMRREVLEEYGVKVKKFEGIGKIRSVEDGVCVYFRHVFLVTGWQGELSNPEGKNKHLHVTLAEAREICVHPISQKVLDFVEARLSGQNS